VTVCVAAMCEQASVVIGAADRMITSGDIEFEPPQTKIIWLTSAIAAMVAGDAGFQIQILNKMREEVDAQVASAPTVWLRVESVARMYEQHYTTLRHNLAQNGVLAPLGLDGNSFVAKQKQMDSQLVLKLASALIDYDVPATAVIFAGVDSSGAHIYTARNGIISCDDVVGFSAIGIGANHADSQLMFAAHTKWKGFADALLTTYTAKKRSEVAPGVGTDTDMFYIGPDLGTRISVGTHVLEKLEEIYQEEQNRQREARQKSLEVTNAYLEELAKPSPAEQKEKKPEDTGPTESANKADSTVSGGQPADQEEPAKEA